MAETRTSCIKCGSSVELMAPCPHCELDRPPTHTITEGPFWAVMLPDGLMGQGFGDYDGKALYIFPPTHYPIGGRVVRVQSVTYEVEDTDG